MAQTVEERLARYRDALDNAAAPATALTAHESRRFEQPRHQINRRPLVTLVAGLLVVVGLAGAAILIRRDPHDETTPSTTVLTGTWRKGATPPFAMPSSVQSAVTSDGRVVVLGGLPHNTDADTPYQGGIYDPAADTWQPIPPAPFVGGATFRLAGTTLVAVTEESPNPMAAALFDLSTMAWTSIDIPAALAVNFRPWTWNGDTLAVVHTGASGLPGDTATPLTMRWSLADKTWHEGTVPPLAPRSMTTTTVSDQSIVVWGGLTTDPTIESATPIDLPSATESTAPTTSVALSGESGSPYTGVFTNGAIYDVADDAWRPIPFDDTMLDFARQPAQAVLDHGRLTLVSSYNGGARLVAGFRDGAWKRLAAPTATGFLQEARFDTVIVATATQSGPQPVQYLDLDDDTWREAPGGDVVRTDTGLVALSTTPDNPGDGPLQAWVLKGGSWHPSADVPIANRMQPAIASVGNLVILVGGAQGSGLAEQSDTWVLDLTKSKVGS